MLSRNEVDDLVLNYDTECPQSRFYETAGRAANKSATGRLPAPVPWPERRGPRAVPLDPVPADTDDLTRFAGYDVVVVTWTAVEALAMPRGIRRRRSMPNGARSRSRRARSPAGR